MSKHGACLRPNALFTKRRRINFAVPPGTHWSCTNDDQTFNVKPIELRELSCAANARFSRNAPAPNTSRPAIVLSRSTADLAGGTRHSDQIKAILDQNQASVGWECA